MRRNLWLRIGLVVAVIAVCAWLLYPPKKTINLGLDLQGGLHLVLGVDVDQAIASQVSRTGDTIKAELEKKGIGVSKVERRGVSELEIQLVSPQQWKDAQTVWTDMGTFDVKESDPATRARRPRPQARGDPPAPRAGRAPGPRDHPEPDRPVRRRRAVDPAAGGQPDPHPAPGRRRSPARQGAHRQDGAARVQARRRQGRSRSGGAGAVPLPADDELLYQRRVDKEHQAGAEDPVCRPEEGVPDRQRPHHRARLHRPEHQRALRIGRVQCGRRQGLRRSHRGQCRAAAGHRPRRQRPFRAGDPRAHPVRPRPDHRRVHDRGCHGPRDRPAGGRAAGAGAVPRGADGGPLARRRLDPQGPHLDGRRRPRGRALHAGLLPALRPDRRRGPRPQPADSHGGHGRVSRHADAARHRGDRVDHRHGGGHQHPDLRADPRGAALGQDGARLDRRRLRPRVPHRRSTPTSPCSCRRRSCTSSGRGP